MSSLISKTPFGFTLSAMCLICVIQMKNEPKNWNNQKLELIGDITIGQNDCDNGSVIVFVHSAATTSGKYFERRQATRETWAQMAVHHRIKVLFVLALPREQLTQQQIITEAQQFGDILQFAFIDDYHNLTLKAVATLRWISTHCKTNEYIVKTDDDIIVNVKRLKENINKKVFSSGITGKMFARSKPIREPHDRNAYKWLVPKQVYDKEFYPRYLSGAAYVMSSDVISKLFRSVLNYSGPVLHIDDLFLTGIIAKAYGIDIHNSPEFYISYSDDEFCGIDVCKMHTISTFHGCNSVAQRRYLWSRWSEISPQECYRGQKAALESRQTSTLISISVLVCAVMVAILFIRNLYHNKRQTEWKNVRNVE